jgi:chromatin segregation and condensation protein Rec8/ScpA/Scc1 (kleisin family)
VDGVGTEKELRCRAAVASTFLGGLELAREGRLALQQDQPWLNIELRPVG